MNPFIKISFHITGKIIERIKKIEIKNLSQEIYQKWINEIVKDELDNIEKVSPHTKAPASGKTIHCPECDYPTKVYNFGWSAIVCWKCEGEIKKNEWYLKSAYERKK